MKYKGYTVYCHTSPSGKRYIGITSNHRLNDRWRGGKGYRVNIHFDNAIKKYGWDNFSHEILESGLTREEACEREKYYIALYDSTDPTKGYNVSLGGGAHSEETKRKIGDAQRGEKNYWHTHKHTEEYCKRMSESCKGKTGHPCSEETKQKLRLARLGKRMSDETKAKILASKADYYQRKKDEKIAKMTPQEREEYFRVKDPDACKNKVYCDGVLYASVTECANAVGSHVSTINPYLNGTRKMPKKWADRGLRYADIDKEYVIAPDRVEHSKKRIIANGVEYASQKECAEALGVSPQLLSNYLHGYRMGNVLKDVVFG